MFLQDIPTFLQLIRSAAGEILIYIPLSHPSNSTQFNLVSSPALISAVFASLPWDKIRRPKHGLCNIFITLNVFLHCKSQYYNANQFILLRASLANRETKKWIMEKYLWNRNCELMRFLNAKIFHEILQCPVCALGDWRLLCSKSSDVFHQQNCIYLFHFLSL